MTGSRLAALLDQATPGPWELQDNMFPTVGPQGRDAPLMEFAVYGKDGRTEAEINCRLVALAPDMARLLVDMAEEIRCHNFTRDPREPMRCNSPEEPLCDACALLARFAALDEKAGAA